MLKARKGNFLLCLALWIFFAIFIIFPVLFVLFSAKGSDFAHLFSQRRFCIILRNTAIECVCSTLISVIAGYIYAYSVVRGSLPLRRLFAVLPVLHLITPPFVGGLSFILLFGRQGFITKTLLGLDISLYGFWGLLLSQVLCFFPLAYLICCQSLMGINPSIEQAARGMGAGRWKVFSSLTLPLSSAGIASSALFIAVSVLSDFGNPLIVGGRFSVLAVEIYTQLTGWLNTGTSAAMGLVLLIPSVLLFVGQNALLRSNSQKIATVGGRFSSGTASSYSAGEFTSRGANIALTVFCSFFAILIAAQVIAVVAGAFQKLWGVNTSFTLDHIKAVLTFRKSLVNSVVFAFLAALIATLIAALTAYITHRTKTPFASGLDAVCQLPSAIPGTLFGLALAYMANTIRFEWSAFLIVIAMAVSYLPFSYRICSSTFSRLKMSLDEAARSLGAGRLKVLFSVVIPLSAGGLSGALTYDFARGVGTLSSVIFLVSFNTSLASIKILNLAEQGDWGKSAALALALTAITFIILSVLRLAFRRFDAKIYEQ